ncbi:MAG: hypothetical protein ACPGTQ_08895 [Colwellia sp.]
MSSTATSNKKNNQYRNRRTLIMVLVAFGLPILLAKLALENQWLEMGVTNKGQLLSNELTLEQLGINNENFAKQWLILYSLPEQCNENCEKALEAVHNTYVALGKEMPRVTPVAMTQSVLSKEQSDQVSKSQWQLVTMPSQAKQYIDHSQVFLVDPLGNVFLSHELPKEHKDLPAFGKQILADMKKVLKYSKVG